MLKLMSYKPRYHTQTCNNQIYVKITENAYGRSGNNMIELANTLWLSDLLNATLIIPKWIVHILVPFNTHFLTKSFCYTTDVDVLASKKTILLDNSGKNVELYKTKIQQPTNSSVSDMVLIFELTSEESFFLFQLYKFPLYNQLLPPHNEALVLEVSMFYARIYSLLWIQPSKKIIAATSYIIANHLKGDFHYVSVHRRLLEGTCSEILSDRTNHATDFYANELPISSSSWKDANFNRNHPLCDMPIPFIKDIVDLHGRNHSLVYLAHDGEGDLSEYKNNNSIHFILNDVLLNEGNHTSFQSVDLKFVDMLVAINSDLFIMNPYSTFSWEIFVIRICLGLQSLPIITNNDIYMHKLSDMIASNRTYWVSWSSILKSLLKVHN
eukprot:gene12280-16469_t